MNKILIDSFSQAITFIVLNQSNEIEDIFIDITSHNSKLGNIYKGVVKNTLKGLEASFVDIGMDQNVYLQDNKQFKKGDRILCQIIKEETELKKSKATNQIKIPGRYLILLLDQEVVNVSKNFQSEERSEHLKKLIEDNKTLKNGYILRTESENADDEDILSELKYFEYLSFTIKEKFLRYPDGTLIYQDEDIVKKAMYDILSSNIEQVITNSPEIFEKLKELYPLKYSKNPNFFHYDNSKISLISKYKLEEKIKTLLSDKVYLKNGGFLCFDSTEALTAIDVNTGKFTQGIGLEDTAFTINKAAALEIAHQVKLRNISGIIIIDFIDMKEEKNKEKIVEILNEEFKKDKVKTTISKITTLGLIEISRKKVKSPLSNHLLQNCPYCQGQGQIYSDSFLIESIKDQIMNYLISSKANAVKVYVNPRILTKIFSSHAFEKDCEDVLVSKMIYIIPNSSFKIHQYKIELDMNTIVDLPDDARLLY